MALSYKELQKLAKGAGIRANQRKSVLVRLLRAEAGGNSDAPRPEPAGLSWLDRLQREAQATELEPSNTQASTFVALSLLQVAVTQCLSWCLLGRGFAVAAALGIGSHWIGFVISVVFGTDAHFDVFEDVSYLSMFWFFYSQIKAPTPRQMLAFGCAAVWGARLVAFLGYRILVRRRDWRFDKLVKATGYNFFGWTSGGTWCWANGFALWTLASAGGASELPLDALDAAGVVIFVAGLACETIADVQKYSFNSSFKSGRNPRWISTGLWALSRHPNYAGENTAWLGMALICVGGAKSFVAGPISTVVARRVLLCLVSPLWSCFFLVFTSLMLLEKRADARWGRNPAYRAYRDSTPVLFPRLC